MARRSVLVIGGGIAGASITRELARANVDVTLLERSSQLCAGATWHAAGLVTRFAGTPNMKKVHVRSLELMTELHRAHDVGLHLTGSIRIVEKANADRLREARQHVAMAALFDPPGLRTELLPASEIARMHPLIDVADVECGVYTPQDGDVDPTMLTNCIAREAQQAGARIEYRREVAHVVPRAHGGFVVTTTDGEARGVDAVVNAAGLWSRRFSEQLDLPHPAMVLEHQYVVTERIPGLAALDGRVPVLRDMRGSSYIRQEGEALLIGPYEPEVALKREWPAGPPAEWAWDLFPPALERIEGCLLSAMALVPALEHVGFKAVVNGPTIWTGDSLARCGRTRVPGYYDFNSLSYGVAQSLALAEYLAHIMLEGEQPYDMAAEVDPLRHGEWATAAQTAAHVAETYRDNNAIAYPFENRASGRDEVRMGAAQRTLHAALARKGAVFSFAGGVQVPLVYDEGALGEQRRFHAHPWAPAAAREAAHVLARVGIGYGAFSKLRVRSDDDDDAARQLLLHATTNALPRQGRCRLTYATTRAGHVVAEFSVACRAPSDYYLVGSRAYAAHDLAWLEQQRREAGLPSVELWDASSEIEILHVAGPASARMLEEICPAMAAMAFMEMRALDVCGVPAEVFRISFTGELGFEVHVAAEDAAPLYDAICAHPAAARHDLRPFGSHALNALRIEKGFRVKADLDYAHWTQAGIAPFVARARLGRAFLGRASPPPCDNARAPAVFLVETDDEHAWSVPDKSPVRDAAAGTLVGYTTSAARGAETQRTVALGYVLNGPDGAPLASPLSSLFVECYGNEWPARMLDEPPVAMRGFG